MLEKWTTVSDASPARGPVLHCHVQAVIPTGAELWCVVVESRQQIGSRNYGYLVVCVVGPDVLAQVRVSARHWKEEEVAGKRDPGSGISRCLQSHFKSGQMSARELILPYGA